MIKKTDLSYSISVAGSFDLIVNTVSATVNVDAYLSLLAFDGVLACAAPPQ